jgi:hypothetical protein
MGFPGADGRLTTVSKEWQEIELLSTSALAAWFSTLIIIGIPLSRLISTVVLSLERGFSHGEELAASFPASEYRRAMVSVLAR